MAYTTRNLIFDALTEIGVLDPVDTLEEEDAATGLSTVQLMADSQEADPRLLFTAKFVPFVLTPNQGTNTLGVGAQFDITASLGATAPRPSTIGPSTVTPITDPTLQYPLTPYARREDYYNEPLKTFTDLYPRRFLYEPSWGAGAYGAGLLTWWPVPTTAATVNLALAVPLTAPVGLDTVLLFPPGYKEFWKLSLARRLSRPFHRQLSQDFKDDLKAIEGLVKRANDVAPPPARSDTAVAGHGGYDIFSNRYRP